jgi:hypothetical protein
MLAGCEYESAESRQRQFRILEFVRMAAKERITQNALALEHENGSQMIGDVECSLL